MLRCFGLFIMVLCLTMSANAQENNKNYKTIIAEQNVKYEQGYATKNAELLLSLHTENATVMPPNRAPAMGRGDIALMLKDDFVFPEYELELISNSIERHGDVAIEIGSYVANLVLVDGTVIKDQGNTVIIWKKQSDGNWLMDVDIFNSTVPLS